MSNQLSVNPIIDGVIYVGSGSSEPVSYSKSVSYDDIIIEIAREIYPTDSLKMVILGYYLPKLKLAFLVSECAGKYELFLSVGDVDYPIFHRLRDGKVYEGDNFVKLAQCALARI